MPATASAVAIIGAGNMAGAIARALLSADRPPLLTVTTRTSVPAWADAPGVTHLATSKRPEANLEAVQGAHAVVLGVKPKDLVATAAAIAPALEPGALVISVAAGVSLAELAAVLPAHAVAVRAMPNTPVAIGRGVTAVTVADSCPADALAGVRSLLAPTGDVEEIAEADFDAFAAVAGSGPAYVYFLMEALRAAAADQGLGEDLAARIVPRMVAGAAEYLLETGREPADLRAEVTSPGGMTHAAITTMDEQGMPQAVRDGIAAAVQRARTLSQG
ncbi:pyrroline-5-carboxylate reductase [Demequina sp.]|uniref:pyrroline-5-carboxylate reductase n=1 Tax=Demequina sp. TaxID=2050685 RepID=UPI003A877190